MSTMPFTSDQVNFLKEQLPLWMAEQYLGKPVAVYEMELHERRVRVEEELKHQREMIQYIIDQMDKRFEQVDKRFEQVEKRFEQVEKRFEQVDKRFEQMDKRFDALTRRMDRFMIWSFTTSLTMAALIIAVLKYT